MQARRLNRAAARDPAERREAAAVFLGFFAAETRPHFRDEEERLFPLLVGAEEPATELRSRALLEHRRLRELAGTLERELSAGDVSATTLRQLGDALTQHIRFEERVLFPLIEQVTPEDVLRGLTAGPR